MRFIDYLLGERIVIDSALPPAWIEKRLDAEIPPLWKRFPTGIVGWVAFGWFSVRYYRSAWFRREMLPVLVGRIRAQGDGSRIVMRYRFRRRLLLIVLLWAWLLYQIFVAPPAHPVDKTLLLLSSTILLVGALGMPTTLREADDDLALLLARIEAAAGRTG